MKRTLVRILSVSLVVCLLIACIPSASALKANTKGTAQFNVITCGDKIFWRTTTVTIKNTGTNLDQILTITNSATNASVNKKSITLSAGTSTTFKITTYLGKAGETSIVVSAPLGGKVSCNVTVNDNSAMARIR